MLNTEQMVKTQAPRVIIFAGPNGAGKSTHADAIVAALGIDTFVNADYIARGLSGRNADAVAMQAGRIMLTRLKELAVARKDFAFESTLSSRSFAPFLRQLKAQGYQVISLYTSPPSLQLAREPDASGEIKDTLHTQPDGLDARLTIARSRKKAAQPGDQAHHLVERGRLVG